ncbi:MAG TPA: prepilin-type N-terminal cleavage/methylation domain-containing protein [Terriglobales bacterium]|nr:prepilin-type N-terminal cleavage/methylation domain-containing protein [Terriglobales bacterium]
MIQRMRRKRAGRKGFSLIEVLIGVFLVAVAVVGLVQLFMMSIMNTARANEIANATFLAQQEIDYLRTLTLNEIAAFPNATRGESDDQTLDLNADGTPDYRRITVITNQNPSFQVEVLVFPPSQFGLSRDTLVAAPESHRVRARLATTITR